MSGLNVALYSSQSALLASQKKMNVTANNLANVDKAGYHRQIAELQHNTPIDTPAGKFGTGSHVQSVVRSFNLALETSLRQSTSNEGDNVIYSEQLEYLEGTLAPDGDSILAMRIQDFSDAMQQVASRPEANDARVDLISKAEAMATEFNETYNLIITQRDGIADSGGSGTLADKVSELNTITEQIQDLNEQIARAEVRIFNPTQANDLRDARDQLVTEMSKLAPVTVTEGSNKAYTITIGGHTVVDGTAGTVDTLSLDMSSGSPVLNWDNSGSPIAATIDDGELYGLTRAWSYIDTKASDLWTYAGNLSSTFNTQHASGFDIDGNAGSATFFDASTAGSMSVGVSDPDDVAASDSAIEPGSGANMRSIWDNLNAADLFEEAEKFVNTIATDTATAIATAETASAGRMMFEDAIASSSAVSIDEEMMEMLNTQRAFQASSRMITSVDNMLEMVLNMI